MGEFEQIFFESREAFRKWLEGNYKSNHGIWMVFYKKHLNVNCIEYIEALEEALCFGWIDSIIKKVDDNKYLRKFTPRTNISNWSDYNKKLVISLISKNQMTEAGLSKIDVYLKTGKVDWDVHNLKSHKKESDLLIPDFILKEFSENEPALTNFNNLAQTYKKHFVLWITSAKREDTIKSRLRESILLLKENRKLGLK